MYCICPTNRGMPKCSDSPRPTVLRLWGTPIINEGARCVLRLPDQQEADQLYYWQHRLMEWASDGKVGRWFER